MISTIAAFLKSSGTWVYIVTVVFFLAYGSYQELKLDRARKSAEEWQVKAETAEQRADTLKAELVKVYAVLDEQIAKMNKTIAKQSGIKKAVADAKKADKGVADWSGTPVPDGIKRVFNGKKHKKR